MLLKLSNLQIMLFPLTLLGKQNLAITIHFIRLSHLIETNTQDKGPQKLGIEPQRSPDHPLQDHSCNTRRITKIGIAKITSSYIMMYLICIGKNTI